MSQCLHASLWRHENFIRVTCEVGNEGNRRFVLADDASTVFFFSADDILKKNAARFREMALAGPRFSLNRLEDEVCRVDLAMRVRIGNAYGFAFVFEDQHVLDLFFRDSVRRYCSLPNTKQVFDFARLEFCKCQTVIWAIANYARYTTCWFVSVNARRLLEGLRRLKTDAGMIVVKNKCPGVVVVACAVDSQGYRDRGSNPRRIPAEHLRYVELFRRSTDDSDDGPQ